jgi:hypothetical protein
MTQPHGGGRPAEPPACYEIRVQGVLDGRWSAWFEGLRITGDELGQTVIVGPVVDQAALHGLLAKVRDLGLPLLSVRQVDIDPDR